MLTSTGIFKPNILPTVLDQYRHQRPYVKTQKNGKKIIIDPEMTINRISLIFYCFVNIGAFFPVATVYAERRIGFWFAFLLPGIIYFLLPLLLLVTYRKTYRQKPNASALDAFFKILAVSFARTKGKFWSKDFWTSSKPSVLAAQGITTWKGKHITWSDSLVHDVHRTVKACGLFFWFPVWYLNNVRPSSPRPINIINTLQGGIGVVANSQAGAMTTKGVPNDLIGNFNSLTIILFIPLLSFVIYPTLTRFNMMPGRITRITFGFTLAWISSLAGAITQLYVYRTSPCGLNATSKSCKEVSPLSVWIQIPMISLGAISECFCQVTAYEIAYARSPKNMKALVMSIFLFQNAISAAIAQIVIPAIKDPILVWVWAAPAICLFVISVLFFIRYRKLNDDEFMTEEALAVDSASEDGIVVEAEGGSSGSRSINEKGAVQMEIGMKQS
jgi:dipeptide/tripeptide permease